MKPSALILLCLLAACSQPIPPEHVQARASVQKSDRSQAALVRQLQRTLRPYWSPMEAGGIFLLADMDDAKTLKAYADLFAYFPAIDAHDDRKKCSELADAVANASYEFFQMGHLKPGVYELENYHLSYAAQGRIPLDSNGSAATALATTATFSFEVRDEHLKLMRHMNTREWSGNVELMDPKRPYGDMTYYYIDVARALGEPVPKDASGQASFSDATIARYTELHREMLFAVQAFWKYGSL